MAFRLIHVSLHAPPTTVLYTLPTRRSSDLDTLRIGDDDRLLALARLGVVVQPMLGQIHDQAGARTGLVVNLPEHRLYYRSEEHTSELQSHHDLVCRLQLEKKKNLYALAR